MKIIEIEKGVTLYGLTRQYFTIENNSGVRYCVSILFDDNGNVIKEECDCKWGTINLSSKKFNTILCKHILYVFAKENFKLPKKYCNKRNLRIIKSFK